MDARQRDLPTRVRVLRVRLTEDEYQLLKAFAERHKTTMSGMVRFFVRAMRDLDQQSRTSTGPPATEAEA